MKLELDKVKLSGGEDDTTPIDYNDLTDGDGTDIHSNGLSDEEISSPDDYDYGATGTENGGDGYDSTSGSIVSDISSTTL